MVAISQRTPERHACAMVPGMTGARRFHKTTLSVETIARGGGLVLR
jgi:hypothetical protein